MGMYTDNFKNYFYPLLGSIKLYSRQKMHALNRYHELLKQIRDGELLNELDDLVVEVITEVLNTGNPGEITLKIKIEKVASNVVIPKEKISFKRPRYDADDDYVEIDVEHMMPKTPEGETLKLFKDDAENRTN